jgi:hypothetical protein
LIHQINKNAMQTTVTLDGYNVVISTLAKEITLVAAKSQYRSWAAMKHRGWDGNDLYDLYQWMSEPDNALTFLSIFEGTTEVKLNQLN